MEADDLLCSQNAHDETVLVRRAQYRAPSCSLSRELTNRNASPGQIVSLGAPGGGRAIRSRAVKDQPPFLKK